MVKFEFESVKDVTPNSNRTISEYEESYEIKHIVHVIGDSHADSFLDTRFGYKEAYKGFAVHNVGPCTAYNLINDGSKTQGGKKVIDLVNSLGTDQRSMFIFGEIDCRIHIYSKFMVDGMYSLHEYIRRTVDQYGLFLRKLMELNFSFAISTIPPANYEQNIYGSKYYAEGEVRAEIYRGFNETLKDWCQKNSVKVADVYSKVVNSDGYIDSKYLRDKVHLNRLTIPFYVEELKRLEMWS